MPRNWMTNDNLIRALQKLPPGIPVVINDDDIIHYHVKSVDLQPIKSLDTPLQIVVSIRTDGEQFNG